MGLWRRVRSSTGVGWLLLAPALLAGCEGIDSVQAPPPIKTTSPFIVRGPALACVTSTSAEVYWRTSTSTTCSSTPYLCAGDGLEHVLTLTGLEPNRVYPYSVWVAGQIAATGVVRTPPTPEGRVAVAAIADAGSGSPTQQRIAKRIDELDPLAVIDVGDICYPNWAEPGRVDRVFFPTQFYGRFLARIPVFTTTGGHDLEPASGNAYYDTFRLPGDERNYITRWGPVDFVAVDYSRDFPGHPINVAVLDSLLRSSTAPWKVVFISDLLYSSGVTHGENVALRAILEPLLIAHHVDLVLQGREHHYERLEPVVASAPLGRGPIYLTIGGGGNEGLYGFGSPKPYSVVRASVNHFLWIEADPNRLVVRCLDPDGKPIDAFAASPVRARGRETLF